MAVCMYQGIFPGCPSLAGLFDPRAALFSGVEGTCVRRVSQHTIRNGLPLGAFLRVHASICGERIGDLLRLTVFCLGLSLVGGPSFFLFLRVSGGNFFSFFRGLVHEVGWCGFL